MSTELDYTALHDQVATEVKKRKFRTRFIFFATTLLIYVLFLLMAGVMINTGHRDVQFAAGGTPPGLLDGLSVITGGLFLMGAVGFIGVMFQGISLYLDTQVGENSLHERLLARAIAKQMRQMGTNGYKQQIKRKRAPAQRLSDDGEMEEEDRQNWTFEPEVHHRDRHE